MILPVYLYGQPVLRKEAEEVPMDYPDLKQLVANMFETMYNADMPLLLFRPFGTDRKS